MDLQEPMTVLSSTYPPAPMDYANQFTGENLKNGKVLQPPKLIKDSYTSFGRSIDPNDTLIRSLESQGLQRLYSLGPSDPTTARASSTSTSKSKSLAASASSHLNINNHKRELKKLNHSILIAYLDLLEILIKAPNTQIQIEQTPPAEAAAAEAPVIIYKTLREQKLEDMELLFINMHHLINELRPHQARDNIRCILEMQKQQRVETARKFKAHLFKIMGLLKRCIQTVNEKTEVAEVSGGGGGGGGGGGSSSQALIDELSALVDNADQISQELDKFETVRKLANDVEMTDTNNKLSLDLKGLGLKSSSSGLQGGNRNCDMKDLILCDLIDELVKENEF